jgi:hypothetical protein
MDVGYLTYYGRNGIAESYKGYLLWGVCGEVDLGGSP